MALLLRLKSAPWGIPLCNFCSGIDESLRDRIHERKQSVIVEYKVENK